MAPRTAKAKKAADVKVAENEAPKKGRGKGKAIEETEEVLPEPMSEPIIDEKAPIEKKKRGKKDTNGDAQINGAEDVVPPTKRGRKKNEPVPEEKSANGDSAEEENIEDDVLNGEEEEEIEEEAPPAAKGRKKPTKKEEKKETAKSKKKQASPEDDEKEVEEKPKGKGRGRKAQPKAEKNEAEDDKTETEEPKELASKGRKKAAPKKEVKEKTPESETPDSSEEKGEEKPEEPKKETKGRKGKKVQPKEGGDEGELKEEPASKKRKVTKKEEKGKGDSKDEEVADEETPEPEPKPKGKRGQKKVEAKSEDLEAEDEPAEAEPTTKARRRKPAEEKAPAEDGKKKAPAKNKATTDYESIDFSHSPSNPQGKQWNFKIASWNVDGIRAWMGKGGLDYLKYEKPDILCLQEVKCARDKLPEELVNVPGYHAYWLCSDKDGYAGVGIYTTQLAMNVQYGLQNEELDDEGRIITAEYEQFYLICTYVPNAGRKLVTLPKRLQWNQAFREYVKELDKKKPVIICGDMNVAHNETDLANPKTNRKNAGFTDEERAGMTDLLSDGFVDTFRHFYPDKTSAYTFWTYMMNARSKNVGWRLDYFIVSQRLLPAVCDNVIRDEVYGSDHCPISLFLHLTSQDKPKEP